MIEAVLVSAPDWAEAVWGAAFIVAAIVAVVDRSLLAAAIALIALGLVLA